MEEFVLPVRKGGLGNQMFQVAAALVYAKETQKRILLPNEFYNHHNSKEQDYAESIFREFIYRIHKPIDGIALNNLLQNGFTQYPGEPGFDEWNPIPVSGNVLLHGYFQHYPPISRHEESIRSVFMNGLGNFRITMTDSVKRVGIHVRRGDYLNHPHCDIMPSPSLSYYEKAIQQFPKDTEFYIFSDDIDWCKQQTLFQELPNKVFIDEKNEVKCLAMMTTCRGGFICANSTFSWWGAFLGCYEKRNPVIVPSLWHKDGVGKLFPPEWIQI